MNRRRHDFEKGDRIEEDVPDRWHRVQARCTRCGESRKVWWAVPMSDLNIGPCIAPRPRWRRDRDRENAPLKPP